MSRKYSRKLLNLGSRKCSDYQLESFFRSLLASGQPLPAKSQTSPADTRLFVAESSDQVWLYVNPGCRNSQPGGLDWIDLKANFLSTSVDMDATGSKVAPNQSVSFTFQITSAGFSPTAYQYNGSNLGLVIGRLGYDALYPAYPTQIGANGTFKVDLSGLPLRSTPPVPYAIRP